MKHLIKFFKKIFSKHANASTQSNQLQKANKPIYLHNRNCYVSTPNAISDVLVKYFHDFIPYARLHYNAQLDLLGNHSLYYGYVKNNDVEKLDIAADYFKRNRSRLFEWWCRSNNNILTSNDEFNVLKDLSCFDDAFEKMCFKLFGINVKPDRKYRYGMPMLNEDGSVNYRIYAKIRIAKYSIFF